MQYRFISIISSILIVVGYLPEIYNLSSSILFDKTYNEQSNNIIWAIWISASGLGCIYGIFIEDYYVSVNCGVNAGLNATIFALRTYKFKKNPVVTNENINIIIP
jgi:hypothetical protein